MGPWSAWPGGRFLPMAEGRNQVIFRVPFNTNHYSTVLSTIHLSCSHQDLAWGLKLKKEGDFQIQNSSAESVKFLSTDRSGKVRICNP